MTTIFIIPWVYDKSNTIFDAIFYKSFFISLWLWFFMPGYDMISSEVIVFICICYILICLMWYSVFKIVRSALPSVRTKDTLRLESKNEIDEHSASEQRIMRITISHQEKLYKRK